MKSLEFTVTAMVMTSVYRSGEEGRYPDMERQCEEKIEALNPTRSDL